MRGSRLGTRKVLFAGLAAQAATEQLALHEAAAYRSIAADAINSDQNADPAAVAEVLLSLGSAQTAAGMADGRASMAAAADAARRAGRWDLEARAAVGYGGALKENQASPVDEALMIARDLGDPRTVAAVLSEFHRALHGPNTMPEALGMANELEALAASLADDAIAFQALNLRLLAASALGDWELAQLAAGQLDGMAKWLRHIEGRRISLSWAICVATAQGRFRAAAEHVEELRELLSKYPEADSEAMLGILQFISLWLAGASELLFGVVKASAAFPAPPLAWFAAEAGLLDEVEASLGTVTAADSSEALDYLWWNEIVSLTRVALRTGDVDLARGVLDAMSPYADGNASMGVVAFLGSGRHHCGGLHLLCGDLDAAVNDYEAAIDRHHVMGWCMKPSATQPRFWQFPTAHRASATLDPFEVSTHLPISDRAIVCVDLRPEEVGVVVDY